MSWSIEPTFAQCNARATAAHRCTICVESESFYCLTDDTDIPLCFIYIRRQGTHDFEDPSTHTNARAKRPGWSDIDGCFGLNECAETQRRRAANAQRHISAEAQKRSGEQSQRHRTETANSRMTEIGRNKNQAFFTNNQTRDVPHLL
jgi:hypothetical protein